LSSPKGTLTVVAARARNDKRVPFGTEHAVSRVYLVNSRRRDGAAEMLSGLRVACAGGSGCGGRTAQR